MARKEDRAVAEPSTCKECFGTLWLHYSVDWTGGKAGGRWRPFDRGSWRALGDVLVATAIAAGTVKPCSCNALRAPPWRGKETAPAPAAGGEGTPF
jgi:hypothetical protein